MIIPNKLTDDIIKAMMSSDVDYNETDIAKYVGEKDQYVVREHIEFLKNEFADRIFLEKFGYGSVYAYIEPDSRTFFKEFLSKGGYAKNESDIKFKEHLAELDMLVRALHNSKLTKYYSILDLKHKIPAVRLWSNEQLETDLNMMSGFEPQIISSSGQVTDIVLRKVENGVVKYLYNPENYKKHKVYEQILDSFKTDEEIRKKKKKELEHRKLIREVFFWRDLRFWGGVLSGSIATAAGLIAIYTFFKDAL